MLILGTLLVTWIVRNWWKILLLLVAVIILYEYQIRKHPENKRTYNSEAGASKEDNADKENEVGTE